MLQFVFYKGGVENAMKSHYTESNPTFVNFEKICSQYSDENVAKVQQK
jgi:hypothetical protein